MDIIQVCKDEAKKSTMLSKHGAVLIHRNKILSVSHNIPPKNSKQYTEDKKYDKYGQRRLFTEGSHAEVSVIRKFLERYPQSWLKNCHMIVIRVNNSDKLLNSKPCNHCEKYIKKYNIRNIYFSQ